MTLKFWELMNLNQHRVTATDPETLRSYVFIGMALSIWIPYGALYIPDEHAVDDAGQGG